MYVSTLRTEKDGWQILTLTRPTPLPANYRQGVWTACLTVLVCCDFDLNHGEITKADENWKFIDDRFKLFIDATRLALAVHDQKYLDYYSHSLIWQFSRAEQLGQRIEEQMKAETAKI